MAIPIDRLKYPGTRKFSAPRTLHEAKSLGIKTAFLSHSHRDKELALNVETYLNNEGIQVYIDWRDESMPDKPTRETAQKIKDRIIATDVFLFLATANSMASRWCPWELGYADGKKIIDQVVVIPTESGGTTYGNEYLDLYRRIDVTPQGTVGIWRPYQPTNIVYMNSSL
jgi:hypothetical protein